MSQMSRCQTHVPRHRDMFEHAGQATARAYATLSGQPGTQILRPGRAYSVGFSPNAGKSSALNVVISAIAPALMRMTSSLNARNSLSPGRRR